MHNYNIDDPQPPSSCHAIHTSRKVEYFYFVKSTTYMQSSQMMDVSKHHDV